MRAEYAGFPPARQTRSISTEGSKLRPLRVQSSPSNLLMANLAGVTLTDARTDGTKLPE